MCTVNTLRLNNENRKRLFEEATILYSLLTNNMRKVANFINEKGILTLSFCQISNRLLTSLCVGAQRGYCSLFVCVSVTGVVFLNCYSLATEALAATNVQQRIDKHVDLTTVVSRTSQKNFRLQRSSAVSRKVKYLTWRFFSML